MSRLSDNWRVISWFIWYDEITRKDKVPTKDMLNKLDLPLVNQLAVEIKLTEVRKSLNIHAYPINLEKYANRLGEMTGHWDQDRMWNERTRKEKQNKTK